MKRQVPYCTINESPSLNVNVVPGVDCFGTRRLDNLQPGINLKQQLLIGYRAAVRCGRYRYLLVQYRYRIMLLVSTWSKGKIREKKSKILELTTFFKEFILSARKKHGIRNFFCHLSFHFHFPITCFCLPVASNKRFLTSCSQPLNSFCLSAVANQ